MNRDGFIRMLRKYARKQGLDLRIIARSGKGSHYKAVLDGRITTLKSGEYSKSYIRLLNKQLGIE